VNGSELAELKLLVVDHVSSLRHQTAGLLRGLAVGGTQMASSGLEAIGLMRQSKPDLVLAEWNMPEMDGLEMLRAMRADERLSDIPVVLVLADVERSLVEQAVASGVSDLLVKPYTLQRLESKIVGAVRRGVPVLATSAPDDKSAAPPLPPPEKATLLVVDDTPDNLRLMAGIFGEDYRVRVADSGEKALKVCAGDVAPDLVLLDVMMPGMDGFEVARRLREQANGETIPIVFVTALTDEASRLRGLDLGAVDFVSKPIDPDVLKLRVRNFIRYVDMHKRRQQEFDAILAEAHRKQALTQQLRDEVAAPLRLALQELEKLQGPGQPEESMIGALDRIKQSLASVLEAAGRCEG
jgi:CheY-like chemotaxis protein